MRKFIYGLVRIFAISSLIFTSCDNFNGSNILEPICANNSESASTETSASKADRLSGQAEYVTLSGSFAPSGAYPEEVVQSFIEPAGGENSSRSAFPAVSTTDTSLTYTITAKCGSSSFSGNISDDKKSYTVSIPVQSEAMTCTVEAKILSGDVTLFSGESESFTISSENPVVTVPDIILKVLSSSGNGSIELEIDVTGSGISYCNVILYPQGEGDGEPIFDDDGSQKKFNAASNKITVTQADVPAGFYKAEFVFYNSSNEIIYKFLDGINVVSSMKTNTWVKNGSDAHLDGNSTKADCKITESLVEGFALDEIYVTDPASAPASLKTGSFFNPLTSFEDAIKKLNNSSKDYTIIIKGTLTGSQTIPDTLKKNGGKYNAKSLTIKGETANAKLDGAFTSANENGTVLNINTTVPVTIKSLTITGGNRKAYNGGAAITAVEDSDVTLGDGSEAGFLNITGNKAERCGCGIYTEGKLTIKKYVKISENIMKPDSNNVSRGALAGDGAAAKYAEVYLEGGEISNNTLDGNTQIIVGNGAGLNLFNTSVYIYGDTVIKNNGNSKIQSGGGIYLRQAECYLGYKNASTKAEWTGSISGNSANKGGAIYMDNTSRLFFDSGSINGNTAVDGGAIYDYGSLEMNLGGSSSISGNTASENGGAIYLSSSNLKLAENVSIPAGSDGKNDIYLKNDTSDIYINIQKKLTGTAPVATITPASYGSGKQVLSGTNSLLTSGYQKFAITPKTGDSGTWTIDSEGKLGVSYSVSAENLASVITGLPACDSVLKVVCTGGVVDYAALNTALKDTSASKVSLDISNVSNTSLGNDTFSGCAKLYEIYLGTTSDADFGGDVFLNCTNLAYIHLYKMESFKDSTFADYRNTDVKLVLCPEGETVAVNAYCTPDSAIPDNWYLVDYECKAADREFTPAQFYKNGTIYKWVPVRE